jgi:L,D-transpeptidase YcbB
MLIINEYCVSSKTNPDLKMKQLAIVVIGFMILTGCQQTEKKQVKIAKRDTTITREVSFTELFIDTTALARFRTKTQLADSVYQRMQSFYNQRNHQFAWFFPDGLAEFVPTFMSLQNDYIYYSGDSSLYNPTLVAQLDSLKDRKRIDPRDPVIVNTELSLTLQFFKYTATAYAGNQQINTRELSWFIPRKKIDAQAFLDSLIKNKGQNLAAYEPVNRQYNLLKQKLVAYYNLEKEADTARIEFNKKLKKELAADAIKAIKKRLILLGDLSAGDTTALSDSTFTNAVRQFQTRTGIKATGEIGPAFINELNVPAASRIQQILINMERIRWMPATPTTDYILVNIPEFQMHVYEKGNLAFNMVVVVGSEAHNTVIFSGTLNQIVFSPYWNIPPGILKNEILPGIKRRPNYLAKHNMEWHNGSVRQKPGKSNSLGLVKFLFPNSYNIYFHDTPSKSLFGESSRAFSHGCIRLSEPDKLAGFLLRKDSTWNADRIKLAMNAGKEKYVRLRRDAEIPVFIGYFTSWVDREGHLNFRKDVYGHDQKMAERLFSKSRDSTIL